METTTEASQVPPPSTAVFSVIVSSIVSLECIAAILFNPLTITAVLVCGLAQKSATNMFIASLSVSDFLSGITIFCFQVQRWISILYGVNPALAAISWISATVSAIAFPGSLISALVIGVDRAIATSRPLTYKQLMSQHNAKLILAAQWSLLCCVVVTPAAYKYATLEQEQRNQLIINPPDVYPEGYTTYFTTPLSYVFLISNTLLYAKVFTSFRKAARRINTQGSNDARSRKLTKMAMMVTATLVICWLPLTIISALPPPEPATEAFHVYSGIYESVFILLLLPSYLNNVIYALQHKDYKMAYLKILGCNRGRGSVGCSVATKTTDSGTPYVITS
ncbi:hypothetical protein CAPTEDRAFT_217095 [Capitella teleta]|uniref:G-protein coupled receptors family 1 profile domain-containing protein n=1 Tax=Capitella teleta TaxID=283909 RepID=R7TG25_CAPTE|nr:hypothetical protein CAPTEDRAFT_217095 [Capitella teleta]|eukprot:ELT92432.1 hypothetical protein CAPTEDRAFT_217095 [Capitella teleta]